MLPLPLLLLLIAGAGAGVVQSLSEKWQNTHYAGLAGAVVAEPATGRGWLITPGQ